MATQQRLLRRVNASQTAFAALWLIVAAVISAFAVHLATMAVRAADREIGDIAGSAARMGNDMRERGHSTAEIISALSAIGKDRNLDVSVETFAPPSGIVSRTPGPNVRFGPMDRDRIAVMFAPPMMDDGIPGPPAAAVHVPGAMVFFRMREDPAGPVFRGWLAAMAMLIVCAVASIWFFQRRSLRQALAPVTTIEGALRRLAEGEYSRLEVVGADADGAGVVAAYNAAADELASSIRRRAEAESNLRQFVAEAGHELRTPLTVIMGFVDVLRQGAIAEQMLAQRILDSVASEGERMRSLIAKLLLLARLDAVAPERNETVDLSDVVIETVDAFRPVAGDTKLSASVEPHIAVSGSSSELREVVGNLLDNAIKYAPGSDVRAQLSRNGRYAMLAIEDNGPGMSAALRARAFDRFSRGDERGSVPGSGLGLAIVKRIATRSGGEVDLQSAPGAGTRVTVKLPIASVQSESSERSV